MLCLCYRRSTAGGLRSEHFWVECSGRTLWRTWGLTRFYQKDRVLLLARRRPGLSGATGDVGSPQDRLWGRGWVATGRGLCKVRRPCTVYPAPRLPGAPHWRTVGKVPPPWSQQPSDLCSQPLTHRRSYSVHDYNPVVTHLQVVGAHAVDRPGLTWSPRRRPAWPHLGELAMTRRCSVLIAWTPYPGSGSSTLP